MIFHKLNGIPDNTGFPFNKLLNLSYTKHASKRVFRYGKNHPVKPPARVTIKKNDVIILETLPSNPNKWRNALVRKSYDKKQDIIFVFKNSRSRFRVITFYLIHKSEYQDFIKSKIKHMQQEQPTTGKYITEQEMDIIREKIGAVTHKVSEDDKKNFSETDIKGTEYKELKEPTYKEINRSEIRPGGYVLDDDNKFKFIKHNGMSKVDSKINENVSCDQPDRNPNRYEKVSELVLAEIRRAKLKHGDKDFNSNHEGFAVMKEEVDEVWDAIKKDDTHDSVKEAIHVAAMAIRYAAERGHY